MKVEVFKCVETGKLFEDEKKFKKHLNDLEVARNIEKDKKIILDRKKKLLSRPRLEAENFAHFGELVKKNFNILAKEYGIPKILSLAFKDLTLNVTASNTHSSPVGHPTNFSRVTDKPNSYIGWNGAIIVNYEKGYNGFDCPLRVTEFEGIYQGSGSGGASSSHSTILWLNDFPNIGDKLKTLLHQINENRNIETERNNLYEKMVDNDDEYIALSARHDELKDEINQLTDFKKRVLDDMLVIKENINAKVINELPFKYPNVSDLMIELGTNGLSNISLNKLEEYFKDKDIINILKNE